MYRVLPAIAGLCLACVHPCFGQGAPTKDTAVIQGDADSKESGEADLSYNGPITATVDWSAVSGSSSSMTYGLDGFKAGEPAVAASPAYQAGLASMGITSMRYHNAGSTGDSKTGDAGWVDVAGKSWDADKIIASLKAWNPPGAVKIINIPGFPAWMTTNGSSFLDKDKYDAYAAFCADLVRIVNVNAKLGVRYFEITNEKDGLYWIDQRSGGQPDRVADLADIYNRAAIAMKKVDPSIKTGGPAAMRPDQDEPLRRWAGAVLPNLDFLSVHMYASGNAADPDMKIFDRTEAMGRAASHFRAFLDTLSPARRIELHVNEYAISWTWETRDIRMRNSIGAVFDALCLAQLASHGADATDAWNECDGTYGKMDDSFTLRPAAETYRLFNRFLIGQIARADSMQAHRVVLFAVKGAAGHGIVLINRNALERQVILQNKGWQPAAGPVAMSRIDATGSVEEHPFDASAMLKGAPCLLPPDSVTLLRWPG